MTSAVQIAINGVAGRMGRQLLAAVMEREDCRIAAGIEASGNPAVGVSVSLLAPSTGASSGDASDSQNGSSVLVSESIEQVIDQFDVVVDFSRPDVTLALIDALEKGAGRSSGNTSRLQGIVIGTTGFTTDERKRVEKSAETLPVVMASNYSVGVTLCLQLLNTTARSLGDAYDVEVIEAHHRNKVDAPSGTALSMGEAVASGLGRDLAECAVYGREGITGARTQKEIGFETIRAGDIIGDHTVLFAGEGERIEITHRATDRMTFARGAIRAAEWLSGQPAGLYDMSDVIGLNS